MEQRLKSSLAAAVLFAGAGACYYFAIVRPAAQTEELRLAQRRTALEECQRAAHMAYDVHWAAACLSVRGQGPGQPDGHAECDLPDDKAAIVNKWLDQAEAQCMTEVRAALAP